MNWIGYLGLFVFIVAWFAGIVSWFVTAYHLFKFNVHFWRGKPSASHSWKALKAGAVFAGCVLVGIAAGSMGAWLGGWQTPHSKVCVLSEEAARGKVWAPTCKGCHEITGHQIDLKQSPGAPGGPNLQNVYMSLAGTQPTPENPTALYQEPYPPLAAARDAGIVWTDENLFRYLRDPKRFLDKVTGKSFDNPMFYMAFFIGSESARRDVIAYLKAIKGHPECD